MRDCCSMFWSFRVWGLLFLLLRDDRPRHPEADDVRTERRRAVVTVGAADVIRKVEDRAATQDTCLLSDTQVILFNIISLSLGIGLVPFLAPVPDIPVHVEEPQVIRLLAPHHSGAPPRASEIPRIF